MAHRANGARAVSPTDSDLSGDFSGVAYTSYRSQPFSRGNANNADPNSYYGSRPSPCQVLFEQSRSSQPSQSGGIKTSNNNKAAHRQVDKQVSAQARSYNLFATSLC
jgi:hypothetical protein